MQAKLTVVAGKANRREVTLALPITIGRSRTAGLTIAHAMVSRQHCRIDEVGGLLRIRDLGSTNGTYVGGNRVEEAVLRPHDQFTIGPLTFEVDYPYAKDSTIVDERMADLARAEGAGSASSEAEPDPQAQAMAAPSFDAMPAAPPGDASHPSPGDASHPSSDEDFELAEQGGDSRPMQAPESPAVFPVPAEPPGEWADSGPEIPSFAPLDLAPPERSDPAHPPIEPDSTISAVSPFRSESDPAPLGYEGMGPGAEGPSVPSQDAETAPWEPPNGDWQPTVLPPRPPRKPKPKPRWWPFGRGK